MIRAHRVAGEWADAKIISVNQDETYDIKFDDDNLGDKQNVEKQYIMYREGETFAGGRGSHSRKMNSRKKSNKKRLKKNRKSKAKKNRKSKAKK